jgi:hypothetical protein
MTGALLLRLDYQRRAGRGIRRGSDYGVSAGSCRCGRLSAGGGRECDRTTLRAVGVRKRKCIIVVSSFWVKASPRVQRPRSRRAGENLRGEVSRCGRWPTSYLRHLREGHDIPRGEPYRRVESGYGSSYSLLQSAWPRTPSCCSSDSPDAHHYPLVRCACCSCQARPAVRQKRTTFKRT